MRPDKRKPEQMRKVTITKNFTCHAEGSVFVEFGNTQLICTASVEETLPPWLKGQNKGWVTAEYGMLPRSTTSRMRREAKNGQSGRTMEIQRLIGRSLRAAVDLEKLGERQIIIDCDVIQADGGTRTAAITGGFVALADSINKLLKEGKLAGEPVLNYVASVSTGIYQGLPILDLNYTEDLNAQTDMNVVMNDEFDFIEVQGTAEETPYSLKELDQMLELARKGIAELFEIQRAVLDG